MFSCVLLKLVRGSSVLTEVLFIECVFSITESIQRDPKCPMVGALMTTVAGHNTLTV